MHCTCRIGQSTQHKQNFLFCILYQVDALHFQHRLAFGTNKTFFLLHCVDALQTQNWLAFSTNKTFYFVNCIRLMHCTCRIGQSTWNKQNFLFCLLLRGLIHCTSSLEVGQGLGYSSLVLMGGLVQGSRSYIIYPLSATYFEEIILFSVY